MQYFGGTNFGRTAGGPLIATSYDYDAPIDEYGVYFRSDKSLLPTFTNKHSHAARCVCFQLCMIYKLFTGQELSGINLIIDLW